MVIDYTISCHLTENSEGLQVHCSLNPCEDSNHRLHYTLPLTTYLVSWITITMPLWFTENPVGNLIIYEMMMTIHAIPNMYQLFVLPFLESSVAGVGCDMTRM